MGIKLYSKFIIINGNNIKNKKLITIPVILISRKSVDIIALNIM